ncbi:MAG: prepilin-type N-terminal cleavage/methylation domain-containing protein [Proteobacteria bacterium]|nr:prepilin-type N-terminal cleavage/methylation domain-containing protein [Pseudomonadota bacterium]
MKSIEKGLSLMEIMITLVIVAVIAGLAYPRYQKMVSRSKQTEAKTILQAIYVGQDFYRTTNQKFSDSLDELDVQLPGEVKYSYSLTVAEDGNSFAAKAMADIDGDPTIDEWQIDQNNRLTNTINDVVE